MTKTATAGDAGQAYYVLAVPPPSIGARRLYLTSDGWSFDLADAQTFASVRALLTFVQHRARSTIAIDEDQEIVRVDTCTSEAELSASENLVNAVEGDTFIVVRADYI